MHRDVPVATVDLGGDGNIVGLVSVHDPEHMPVGTVTGGAVRPDRFADWWRNRAIPSSRPGVDGVLRSLNLHSTAYLVIESKGLSLSDQYWLRSPGSDDQWRDVNFFDNPFSDDLGDMLFGMGIDGDRPDLCSPDSTTDGFLMKCWTVVDGVRTLLKAGTDPLFQEPINEVMASMISTAVGIDHVGYRLTERNGLLCSACSDFITGGTELIPAHGVIRSEIREPGISLYDHYVGCCAHHGIDVVPAMDRMIVLDYLIANRDRHLNNFGIIRDSDSLKWIGPAPIYDSGSSLGFDHDVLDLDNRLVVSCKPFSDIWSAQMDLVTDVSWLDFDALDGAIDECAEMLSGIESYRSRGCDVAIVQLLRSRASELREWAAGRPRRAVPREKRPSVARDYNNRHKRRPYTSRQCIQNRFRTSSPHWALQRARS